MKNTFFLPKNQISKVNFCFLFFLFFSVTHSQTSLLWAKSMGGTDLDSPVASTIDSAGNIYTVGNFIGTSDFDPGPNTFNLIAVANRDIFISKLDSLGNFIWAKSIGGTGIEYVESITLNSAGEIFLSGSFNETAYFDPTNPNYNITSLGQYDAFIAKLDSFGNLIWVKTFGGIGIESCSNISFDSADNIYCTGGFQQTVDFDPNSSVFNLTSSGGVNSNVYILKLDSSGVFLWAKKCGGTTAGSSSGARILLDSIENIYIVGLFRDTADFDPSTGVFNLTSNGSSDIFYMKLDASGNFVWAKKIGGTATDFSRLSIIDGSGNIYTVGNFSNIVDFDPSEGVFNLTSLGGSDIFIFKIDSSGGLVWAKRLGSTNSSDVANSIFLDGSANIYVAGGFNNTVDFDPNNGVYNLNSTSNSLDSFVLKLDPTGNFVWAKSIGGPANDQSNSVVVEPSGDVIISGSYQLTADFNPQTEVFNITSMGFTDTFVAKFGQEDLGIDQIFAENQVNVYPNPNNGFFKIDLKKDTNIRVYNVLGIEVKQQYLYFGMNTVDLQNVNDGVYFLQIGDEIEKVIHKIIIKH